MEKEMTPREIIELESGRSDLLFLKEEEGIYSHEDTIKQLKIIIHHKEATDEKVLFGFSFIGFMGRFSNVVDSFEVNVNKLSQAFEYIHAEVLPKIDSGLQASLIGSDDKADFQFLLNGSCRSVWNRKSPKDSKIKRYFTSEIQAKQFTSLIGDFIEFGEATLYELSGKNQNQVAKFVFDSGEVHTEYSNQAPTRRQRKAG